MGELLHYVFTGISLYGLIDRNGVIREVEEDDEPPVHVNWSSGVHTSHKSQHIVIQTISILFHKFSEVPGVENFEVESLVELVQYHARFNWHLQNANAELSSKQ